ncbi:hypothetical protein GCM10009809_30170 [Isoptericola hypogeus]|uniref:Uncharacterized protein n=1 Tax=Isoptericola hypogeus TaxID=300179 RepID=A0ABN2JML1_9MICO
MPVRAVVVPATPLLVPGASGGARVLSATRDLVGAALGELVAHALRPGAPAGLLVLASAGRQGARGPVRSGRPRSGRLRPSLAGAGIADRWVPGVAAWPPSDEATYAPDDVAHVPASVALLCLAAALEARGAAGALAEVEVVEVPARLHAEDAEVLRLRLRAAAAVVAADDDGPVVGTLGDVAGRAGWIPEVRIAAEAHEHLQERYDVTVWRSGA